MTADQQCQAVREGETERRKNNDKGAVHCSGKSIG